MGGVPALLLVIAAGITYGWQPDREGGVEYIIQVPPDQIERLEKVGEISSVIDPAVRGHVSRVIIRVGNEPVPRTTPASLSGRTAATAGPPTSELAWMDNAHIPVPQMAVPIAQAAEGSVPEPIPGHDYATQSLLKPDTNSPPGSPSYGFPGMPPTLTTGAPQVDQAGRPVGGQPGSQANSIFGTQPPVTNTNGAAAPTSGSVRVAPPATRIAPATGQSPPPFTGSDPQGDYARARTGGPSTDPTSPRDNTWRDFPGPPPTTAASTTSQLPSGSTAENPFRSPNMTNAGTSTSAGSYGASGNTGLAPRDTYGQLPSGFSFSGADRASPTASNGTSAYGSNAVNAPAPDPRLTPAQVAAGAWSIDATTGQIHDRQGQPMRGGFSGSTPTSGTGPAYGSSPTYNSNANFAGTGFSNQATNTHSNGSQGANSTLGQPTEFPHGLGYDANQLQSSQGRSTGYPMQVSDPRGGIDATNQPPARAFPSNYGTTTASGIADGGLAGQQSIRRTSAIAADQSATSRQAALDHRLDPPSLTDPQAQTGTRETDARRDVVAPQPLFNGLLLISLVANVYLIFWLKNLRLQFRDLVAAKRMASSNST